MALIKNIIFDLGGVLLDIDFNKTKKAFERLGVQDFDNLYTKESANPVFELLETGASGNEDFYTAMQAYCRPGTSFGQIKNAWNEIFVGFRKQSVAHLQQLQKKYSLYLLSNTNAIHHAEIIRMFTNEIGGRPFDEYFTKAWYSHLIQKRKPYTDTYLYVIKEGGLQPTETLFIDDSFVNIEGAAKAGLQTRLLKTGEKIENLPL